MMRRRIRMRPLLALAVTACVACSSSDAVAHPQPRAACGDVNESIEVAKTFVRAVEADDVAGFRGCEYPGTVLREDLFRDAPFGGWRLDEVTIQTGYLPPPPSNAIVYRVPAPDSPNDFGPPHQSGLNIIVSLEPDGLYYVTDLRLYTST